MDLTQETKQSTALDFLLTLSISLMESAHGIGWVKRDERVDAYEIYQQLCREGQGESECAKRYLIKVGDYPTQMAQAREAHKLLYFMKTVWDKFGNDILIMRQEDFAKVCKKYRLVVGFLDDYIGEIPEINQCELEIAHAVFDGNEAYVSKNFPRYIEYDGFMSGLYLHGARCHFTHWYIAAPSGSFYDVPSLFPDSHPLNMGLDPFVFTVSELGYILIHSKWGTEAEDTTIKRYEELRDAIINKGLLK